MKIDDPKYFKLKIEDMKYRRNDDGTLSFSEWTGYGPIRVLFGKTVFLKRGRRLPKFTMRYKHKGKNMILYIDVTKYLKNHVSYLQYKEEKSALGDYKENVPKERQLDLFEDFCRKFS